MRSRRDFLRKISSLAAAGAGFTRLGSISANAQTAGGYRALVCVFLFGGNDGGKGITDTPGGLKLQCEGHDVRFRNIWIKELDLASPNTSFSRDA